MITQEAVLDIAREAIYTTSLHQLRFCLFR